MSSASNQNWTTSADVGPALARTAAVVGPMFATTNLNPQSWCGSFSGTMTSYQLNALLFMVRRCLGGFPVGLCVAPRGAFAQHIFRGMNAATPIGQEHHTSGKQNRGGLGKHPHKS